MEKLNTLLAQIGRIQPTGIPSAIGSGGTLPGLVNFANILLRLVLIAAGLFVFINFIIAGFGFIGAGGDPKSITKAWDRIWQSLLGLLIIISSFLVAAIIGIIFFRNPTAILNPKLQ